MKRGKVNKKENEFFDINKFPAKEGILFFGISMSRIETGQSAKKYIEYIDKDLISKIQKPVVGANFIYSDNLYLYSSGKASKLKRKHQSQIEGHKGNMMNILNKNKWYIQKSFSFSTWNQLLLECKNFTIHLDKIVRLYKKDKNFKKFVNKDIKNVGKRVNQDNVLFILEESLIFYLVTKGQVGLSNDYIDNKQKWILNCYPGKPLYTGAYLYQKNPLRLSNPKNKYENCFYDLEEKKLYDFDNMDLNTVKLE